MKGARTLLSALDKAPLRNHAPLLNSYLTYLEKKSNPFTIPGHKQRAHELDAGLGKCVDVDVPLYGGLDEIKLTNKVLVKSEALAAKLWGADWCRFSTGGSTHVNQALLLALGQPGDKLAVSRTAHRSSFLGMVMAGLEPEWIMPVLDEKTGIPMGLDPVEVAAVLARSGAKAVSVIEPGYMGTLSDMTGLANACHKKGVPLIVDQAWGGHFGFHPDLPKHAMQAGADAFVTSVHKCLPGYSASAMVVARTKYLSAARLDQAFEAGHTTSPAGATLASCDGTRALLELRGKELLGSMLKRVHHARQRLIAEFGEEIVLQPSNFPKGRFDPAKLVIRTAPIGAHGVAVEKELLTKNVRVELADRDTLVAIVTLVDSDEQVDALVSALIPALHRNRAAPRPKEVAISWSVKPQRVVSLREAFFAEVEMVDSAAAVGRVSADLVAPYPPGVPVLAPGEKITRDIIDGLAKVAETGVRVAYATDPSLKQFRVIR